MSRLDAWYPFVRLFYPIEHGTLLRPQDGSGVGELPEDEGDMPTLPPNKDPSGQTISKPLLSKRPPNKQQMVRNSSNSFLLQIEMRFSTINAWA